MASIVRRIRRDIMAGGTRRDRSLRRKWHAKVGLPFLGARMEREGVLPHKDFQRALRMNADLERYAAAMRRAEARGRA